MPTGDNRSDVVRMLTGVRGTVRMRHEWVVRLDYGLIIPWVRQRDIRGERAITAVAGPDKLILRGSRLPDRRQAPPRRRVRRRGRRGADLLDDLDPVVRAHAAERRPSDPADHRRRARVGEPVPRRRAARRRRPPVAAHAAADDPRADRRHRGRADDLAARGLRRRAQLGLPLLLAARRRADDRVAHRRRLHRRGQVLAALAAARRGRRPRRPADHVRRRRRAAPARAHPRPPARLRGVAARADRQRRRRAEADRRDGRGDDRPGRRPQRRARRRRRRLGPPALTGQPAGRHLAGARPRHLGDPRSPAALHPLAGDGVGGVRPRRPRRRGRRAWKDRSTAGARPATRCARRS